MLFTDFASSIRRGSDLNRVCALLQHQDDQSDGEASVYSSGKVRLIHSTARRRAIRADINGTGLLVLGSQSEENRSVQNRGFVSGNMSVRISSGRAEGCDY